MFEALARKSLTDHETGIRDQPACESTLIPILQAGIG
jgi:hypothetical protein